MAFKEALDLGLGFKTARGVSFKSLNHDRGQRLITHQQFATAFLGHVFVTRWGIVYPIATLHAGLHFLGYLPPILFALQCALSGHDGFYELTLGRVVELEVQTFNSGTPFAEGITQIEMETGVAGKTLEIIKDDDIVFMGQGIEITQERHHAGALHEVAAAGDRVGERGLNQIALGLRIFAATGFLGLKSVAFLLLAF